MAPALTTAFIAALLLSAALFAKPADAFNLTHSALRARRNLCPAVAVCLKQLDEGSKCDTLPVPKRAFVPPIADGTFRLFEIRPGIWAYDDFGFISLIIIVGKRLAVIDFPDSPGSNKPDGGTYVIDAVEQVLDGLVPKRIDMVYSHDHYDHIGSATRFFEHASSKYASAQILIWGTFETRRKINASQSKRAVPPNIIVGLRGRTLSVGDGIDVKMKIVGGHSGSDLLLHIPRKGDLPAIAMIADIVFPRWAPFLNMGLTEDLARYLEVHKEILKLDFKIFIGGHMRVGTRGDVMNNMRFTQDIIQASQTALETVSLEEIQEAGLAKVGDPNAVEFGNIWFAFIGTVRRLQIAKCVRIMLEKWGCRIGGLDLSVESHCLTAISFVAFSG